MEMGGGIVMKQIDLNCDLGESFGTYQQGDDAAIMPYISSANIACGFHAGDAATMEQTVQLALQHNVSIGAHPGLPDLQGFGRRRMDITAKEAYQLVVYQVGALAAFVTAEGGRLHHVKMHGALYHMVSTNTALAEAVVEAIYRIDPSLYIYGFPNSALLQAAKRLGLHTANEVFADRTYQSDGLLTPRTEDNAMISTIEQAVKQVMMMVENGEVTTIENQSLQIQPETICIHGDGKRAVSFAKAVRTALYQAGISIGPV